MPAIVWNDTYSVRIKQLDQQHQQLVKLVNELDEAMRSGKGKDVLAKTLSTLIDYTKTHFVTEERLLQTFGYPEFMAHKVEHDRLTEKVLQLQQQIAKSQIGLTIPIMTFLCDWLRTHILGSDMKYGSFLNGKGVV